MGTSVLAAGGDCHCDGTFLRAWGSRKSQTSIIYVQVLGNLFNDSENQSVIRNSSKALSGQAGCEVAQFEMPMLEGSVHSQSCHCSTTALQTQFVQIKPSLSVFVGQSAVAQLFWLEVSPTQLQSEGHSALAFRELQAGCHWCVSPVFIHLHRGGFACGCLEGCLGPGETEWLWICCNTQIKLTQDSNGKIQAGMLMGDAIVGFIDDRSSVTENSVKQ